VEQLLLGQACKIFRPYLFDFDLELEQTQQIDGFVRLVDPLHQGGARVGVRRITGTVRVQRTGQLAVDLAQRHAGFEPGLLALGGLLLSPTGTPAACGAALLRPVLPRLLAQIGFGIHAFVDLPQQFGRIVRLMIGDCMLAEHLAEHGLCRLQLRGLALVSIHSAMPGEQLFQLRIILLGVIELLQQRFSLLDHWDSIDESSVRQYVIYMSADDLMRLAILVANDGEHRGKRLVSANWFRDMTVAHSTTDTDLKESFGGGLFDGYGYLWWSRQQNGRRLICADGWGGQYIIIDPETRVVLVNRRNTGTNLLAQGLFLWRGVETDRAYMYALFEQVNKLLQTGSSADKSSPINR
jgi:hypothetical protein